MRPRVSPAVSACFLLACFALEASAADRQYAELLPPTVVAYAHLADPPKLVETIWDHPLRPRVEELPQVLEARKRKEFQQFQVVLRLVEFKLGEFWRPALARATGGGVAVAFDRESNGVALLVKTDDPAFLQKARDTLFEFARGEAEKNGQPSPITDVEYRGITAHRIGEARMALVENWLVVTNSDDLGRAILDRHVDNELPSLADAQQFQQAIGDDAEGATLWAYVDLNAIREAGIAEDIFRGHAKDFGGELILGGVLTVLQNSPHAAAGLDVTSDAIRLSLKAPHGGAESLAQYDYFFGPDARGRAPDAIEVEGQLASIRAYRGIGDLWLRGPDLFEEGVAAQMASTESNLSTLFGGRRFGEEVLGGIAPELQIVAAAQDYSATGVPEPSIKIPAFALVAQMKDPAESQRSLKIAYQTAIGFVNLAAGQQGYPPLELDIAKKDEATVISATYSAEDYPSTEDEPSGAAAGPPGRLQYNFSPTVAFAGENFVVASTKELADELVGKLAAAAANGDANSSENNATDAIVNSSVRLAVVPIHDVLAANREHLVNQNMIEEGHDREAAQREIDGLLTILSFVREVAAELVHDDATLQLNLELLRAE
jgi:hypothetical protein